MQKHLFLTGPSDADNSSLIRTALGNSLAVAGGFVTESALDDDGAVLGCDMMPAAAAGGVEGFEKARFLSFTSQPPKTDNEVFRSLGVRLLQEAEFYPYALLDVFGGFELIIPQFREALLDLLNNDALPCIGVIRGKDSARQLRRCLGLGDKYPAYHKALIAALKADSDTLLLEVTRWNMKKVEAQVYQWVEQYAK